MSFLYWARYGFLFMMVLVIAILIYAHWKSNRSQ
jgi:hypothetical protein